MSLSKIISDESFFGRGNDTQMRYVDGELSHVNKQEAELIDKYGKKGEQKNMVQVQSIRIQVEENIFLIQLVYQLMLLLGH